MEATDRLAPRFSEDKDMMPKWNAQLYAPLCLLVLLWVLVGLHCLHSHPYSPYTLTYLGTPEGYRNYVYALNDRGQVVGCADTTDGGYHACLWEWGHRRDL